MCGARGYAFCRLCLYTQRKILTSTAPFPLISHTLRVGVARWLSGAADEQPSESSLLRYVALLAARAAYQDLLGMCLWTLVLTAKVRNALVVLNQTREDYTVQGCGSCANYLL